MKGQVVLLRSRENTRAYDMLRNIENLDDVNIYGDSIHLVVQDADKVIPDIQKVLIESQIEIVELRHIEATIEDVFVALGKEKTL